MFKKLAALVVGFLVGLSPFLMAANYRFEIPYGGGNELGRLLAANFNTTADQPIAVNSPRYVLRRIIVQNCSGSVTVAAGGFYTGASKTGTTVVGAAQVYTALTGSTKFLNPTLGSAVTTDVLTAQTIYLSLTTAQGGAMTCDVHLVGDNLS